MPQMRVKIRRPKILAIALTLSVLAAVTAAYVVTATGHDSDSAEAQQAYQPWESPQLFAFPGEWNNITATTVHTTYPFQTSLQRMLRPQHPGSESVAAGTSCAACHGSAIEEQSSVAGWAGPPADHYQSNGCVACHGLLEQDVTALGESLANREFAADYGTGFKAGFVDVEVQAAYDEEYMYIKLDWASERPGISHDLFRFNGEEWVRYGGGLPGVLETGELASNEDRISINFASADIPAYDGATGASFATAGCYLGCHDDAIEMPDEPDAAVVEAHPDVGADGLNLDEITKYLLNTRSVNDGNAGWDALKPEDERAALYADGQFLEMWMWRGARGGPVGYSDDFYVLEGRFADDGTSAWITQGPPEYMYDPDITGFNAIPEDQFEEMLNDHPLIVGVNAIPIDDDTEFQEGDILPRRVLRLPDGSRADVLANSRWEDGRWTVVLRRALDTGNPEDHQFIPGHVYTIGIAVFDDHSGGRHHQVSFPVTIGLGAFADIVAVPLVQGQ